MRQRGFIYISTGQWIAFWIMVAVVIVGGWELVRWLFSHISFSWS